MFQVLSLNKVLYDLLVAKDGKLLLERGLLFEGYVKLEKGLMDVVHHFEKVERESNVDVGWVYELIERIIIELLNKVVEEDFITVHLVVVSIFEFISLEVKQLDWLFAWALGVLALSNMHIDDSYHSHLFLKVNLSAFWEISHLIDL
jgi:hypothetical protein